jgi:D-alanyl-D-alanine carboxypeptidase
VTGVTASVFRPAEALRALRFGLAGLAILALAACQSAQQAPRPSAMAAAAAVPAVQATAAPAPLAVSLAPAKAEVRGKSVLVVDMATGQELDSFNADAPRYPASLTKMMTLYLLFEAIDRGEISLDSQLPVSARAASRPPAKLGVGAGGSLRVEEAVQALAIRSANDMAVAVAERLAGSEDAFAAEMSRKALELGMSRTRFVNASGLPDTRQVTTARDMATLGQALRRRFPQHMHYFSEPSFQFRGRTIEATNKLLGKVPGVDGLKTGHIDMSGYNLVATGSRNGRQLMVVVLGGPTEAARDREVTALFERYFASDTASLMN